MRDPNDESADGYLGAPTTAYDIALKKARERKPCDHVWEYVNGPDDAANFLCSRCDAAIVAPVARSNPH